MKRFVKNFLMGNVVGLIVCAVIGFIVGPVMLVFENILSPWWMVPWFVIVCGIMGVALNDIYGSRSRSLPQVRHRVKTPPVKPPRGDEGGYTPNGKLDTSNPPKGGSGMVYPRAKPPADDLPVGYPGDILNPEHTWISPIYKKPDGLSYRFENGVEICLGEL